MIGTTLTVHRVLLVRVEEIGAEECRDEKQDVPVGERRCEITELSAD